MQHFFDKQLIGSDLLTIKTVEKGGVVEVEGLQEVITKANAAIKTATDATTAKDAAIAEKATIEAETAIFKAAIVTEITGLQLALKMTTPKTVAELEALKAADLIAMRTELHKQFESNEAKATEKSIDYSTINH